MTEQLSRRRPISVRASPLAQKSAAWLAKCGVTPNRISLAGLGFAAIGAIAIGLAGLGWGWRPALYLIGVLMIELRLLCNLFDGMVAVEGGKATPAGELFNEVPDRFADAFLLIGAGVAVASQFGVVLGLIATLLAILTAYARALGSSMGLPADFSGPMAKPHRMQTLALACAICAAVSGMNWDRTMMTCALIVIVLGTAITLVRRLKHAYDALMRRR